MQLQAERVTLSKLFAVDGEQFEVPPYQRPYAWGADQIDDLWDDLVSAVGRGHFIGSIVLSMENEDRPQIIDGQQRLTTLLLLLGLIRDEYFRLGSKLAERPQALMYSDLFAHGDAMFKLRPGSANRRLFRDGVLRSPWDEDRIDLLGGEGDKEERRRNAALIDNAKRLKDRLTDHLTGRPDAAQLERLEALEQTISKKLDIVAIRVGTISDAFLLFETLNDRGLQLSAADLLKNHLLAKVADVTESEDEVRRVAAEWDKMLDDLGAGVDVVRFFRHFLLVRIPSVSKDRVYDEFKRTVAEVGAETVLEALRRGAQSYGQFEDPSKVAGEEPEVAAVLRDLQTLRAASCYVLLLPARRYLSSEQFTFVCRLAETLTYRHSSIAGLDNKALERAYHRSAKLLDESQGDAFDDAVELLIKALPDRETFIAGFMRQRMGVQYLVRYTLRRIEEHLNPGKELKDTGSVHLEHILPQTLSDPWREALGSRWMEHDEWVHRWGNLTFLWYSLNIQASNSAFEAKKKHYEASDVSLTQELCALDRWDFDAIEARQLRLATLAEQIWSADVLMGGKVGVPEPPESSPAGLGLPSELESTVKSLAAESSFHELLEQRARVIGHLSVIEIEAATHPAVDLHLAKRIHDALIGLIDVSASLDGEQRGLVRAAVEYFVLADDVAHDLTGEDGFVDDAAVVDAVAAAVGRPELGVHAQN